MPSEESTATGKNCVQHLNQSLRFAVSFPSILEIHYMQYCHLQHVKLWDLGYK